ncbi:hypothetical protein [Paraflavitalea speifideaquila]|uniref:hypothetical protein n=1 Tax=Paraflavitalea speifideaquila TaxID=3076558 RepID=UPI0028E7017B|nr:hypothetical protein [Paraflavitalea speifideiaquila]
MHGCTIEDNVLVGMGAIIMDNVEVGSLSIIAAGAVVLKVPKSPPEVSMPGCPPSV